MNLGTKDTLMIDEAFSSVNLKAFTLGSVEAGQSLTKTMVLEPLGRGKRHLDLVISAFKQLELEEPVGSAWTDVKPIVFEVQEPISCEVEVEDLVDLTAPKQKGSKLLDLSVPGIWDEATKVLVNATLVSHSPISLSMAQVEMACEVRVDIPNEIMSHLMSLVDQRLIYLFSFLRIHRVQFGFSQGLLTLTQMCPKFWVSHLVKTLSLLLVFDISCFCLEGKLEVGSAFSIIYVVEVAAGSMRESISGGSLVIRWSRYWVS